MSFKLRAPPPLSQVLRGPSLSQGVFQAPRKAALAAVEQLTAIWLFLDPWGGTSVRKTAASPAETTKMVGAC